MGMNRNEAYRRVIDGIRFIHPALEISANFKQVCRRELLVYDFLEYL